MQKKYSSYKYLSFAWPRRKKKCVKKLHNLIFQPKKTLSVPSSSNRVARLETQSGESDSKYHALTFRLCAHINRDFESKRLYFDKKEHKKWNFTDFSLPRPWPKNGSAARLINGFSSKWKKSNSDLIFLGENARTRLVSLQIIQPCLPMQWTILAFTIQAMKFI